MILEIGGFVLPEQTHLESMSACQETPVISYRALHFCCPVCYFYGEFHKDMEGMLTSDLKWEGSYISYYPRIMIKKSYQIEMLG